MAKTQQRLPRADAPVLLPELIMEILSWVPIKSLMRFRCVSKTWNSLMFDPTFVKLHHQRSSKNTHVLVRSYDRREGYQQYLTTCTIRGLFENPSSTIDDDCDQIDINYLFVGSCNGLVCLIYPDFEYEELWVRFWNPATRIMSEDSPHVSTLHSSCLDPNKGSQFVQFVRYGFGYNEWSDTYKVVIFLSDAKYENWVVKVHCLGDTYWRYSLTCPAFPMMGGIDGQFACGSLNWLVIQKSGYDYQWETVKQLAILSFDLNSETYKYFSMPDGLSEVPSNTLNLGVLKGCLCLSQDHRRTHFVVWHMREFGVEKSWTQLVNVTYELPQVFFFTPSFMPVCISENDDALLLADYNNDKFMLCNLRDNRIERIVDFNGQAPFPSHDYVHSLVLPYQN